MSRLKALLLTSLLAACLGVLPALAEVPEPIPISAMDAFMAYQTQTDPLSGAPAKVALVDNRTRAEYFWIGAAAQVDEIVLKNGNSLYPDLGRTILRFGGRLMTFTVDGKHVILPIKHIDKVNTSPIGTLIPFKLWDEDTGTLHPNGENYAIFREKVEALALEEGYDIVIFFCRSGGRSQACLADFDVTLFDEIYEIDQPDGKSGRGGFEGTTYGNVYNGYRGFPDRVTFFQEHESVAWKDAGLPIKIGVKPPLE
jgi:rhodanese-related sulfurtransferase